MYVIHAVAYYVHINTPGEQNFLSEVGVGVCVYVSVVCECQWSPTCRSCVTYFASKGSSGLTNGCKDAG